MVEQGFLLDEGRWVKAIARTTGWTEKVTRE